MLFYELLFALGIAGVGAYFANTYFRYFMLMLYKRPVDPEPKGEWCDEFTYAGGVVYILLMGSVALFLFCAFIFPFVSIVFIGLYVLTAILAPVIGSAYIKGRKAFADISYYKPPPKDRKLLPPPTQEELQPKNTPTTVKPLSIEDAIRRCSIPAKFKPLVIETIRGTGETDGRSFKVSGIEKMFSELPMVPFSLNRGRGATIRDYLVDKKNAEIGTTNYNLVDVFAYAEHRPIDLAIQSLVLSIEIPDELRTEHMMLVAQSGHGKTQAIQELLLSDLKTQYPVVVIDSQEAMIEKLLHVVPEDRLIYLDGSAPLALNPFDIGDTSDDGMVTTALDLFENMFAVMETELTTKQRTLYRYVARLLLEIPGATFETMIQVLKGDVPQEYVRKLPSVAQSFFADQFQEKSYNETKNQIAERIYTLLENGTLARMFSAPESAANFDQALKANKVILVNTAQSTLGLKGASLFGRYCIMQLGLAVLKRRETRDRVYCYVDEFQEYATNAPVFARLFEQGRKRGLCMCVAFHRLGQMDSGLADLMRTNTSIKLVGAVNSSDASALAKDMRTDAESLQNVPTLSFKAFFKGYGTHTYTVTPGALEGVPQRDTAAIKARQIEKYGHLPTVAENEDSEDKIAEYIEDEKPPTNSQDEQDLD